MKKLIIIVSVLLSGFVPTGCEDLAMLEEKPKKETTEGFMDTPEQIEAVLFSCYYQLRRDYCFTRYYHSTVEAMADYCYFVGSYEAAGRYQGLDGTLTTRLANMWNILYRSIRFSNTILLDAPGARNTSKERLEELLAEARFLRGFAYLSLARAWGGVPLLTEENQRRGGEHNIPRATEAETFRYAMADLEFAAQYLPARQPVIGRPQRTTAKTVLTEVYLYLGEWEKARDTALEVIESGAYSLVEVSASDDFYKIFHPALVNSTEEIFYFKYKEGKELGSQHAAMLHGSAQYYDGSFTKGIKSDYGNKFMKQWSDRDLRKGFNIYTVRENGVDIIYNKKFLGINASGQYSANDYTLYRYADLLLYYAEAECRHNKRPTPDALEKLNMVHRRAYGKPSTIPDPTVDFKLADYADEEAFLKLVFRERGYETCYEGKRYDDMKRMGYLAEEVKDVKGIEVGPGGYWFPIPAEEFLYNKGLNVDTDQNPGY